MADLGTESRSRTAEPSSSPLTPDMLWGIAASLSQHPTNRDPNQVYLGEISPHAEDCLCTQYGITYRSLERRVGEISHPPKYHPETDTLCYQRRLT